MSQEVPSLLKGKKKRPHGGLYWGLGFFQLKKQVIEKGVPCSSRKRSGKSKMEVKGNDSKGEGGISHEGSQVFRKIEQVGIEK